MSNNMHLTVKQLCDCWHIAYQTLQSWRTSGYGPKYMKWGKQVLYPLVEVEAWEAKHLVGNTAESELIP